jgi:hypothetical protein
MTTVFISENTIVEKIAQFSADHPDSVTYDLSNGGMQLIFSRPLCEHLGEGDLGAGHSILDQMDASKRNRIGEEMASRPQAMKFAKLPQDLANKQ